MGSAYAVAMNSGTSTLHAALEAVGVQAGDEVISPALTVIMDTTATLHANAIPIYADVDPDTFNIDVEDVRRKITSRTKAILAVSLYGLPCDLMPLRELSDAYGIALIEDNAQCVLSTYKGKPVGSWGDVASWSFENTKHLSAGEGGMVTTDSEELAESMRKIGGHGFRNLKASEGRVRLNMDVFQDPHYKRHDVVGWNYRMPEFTAAVALAQLERIDELVELRRQSAAAFLEVMADCEYLTPQVVTDDRTHSYYTLAAKYDQVAARGVTWQEFRAAYMRAGGDGIYGAWSVPYLEPVIAEGAFRSRLPSVYADIHYEQGLCPVAESIQPMIMQFKTNYRDPQIAREKAGLLANTIRDLKVGL
jgi:perosamine synthetase